MQLLTQTSALSRTPRHMRILRATFALSLSLAALSGRAVAQSANAPDVAATESAIARTTAVAPLPGSLAAPSGPVAAGAAVGTSVMLNQRAVGLTRRVASDSTAPAPMMRRETSRTNTALMIVGAAAVILGAAVGDDAGTVLIIGGAGIGLYGLYRFLN